jgi:hypothetical protein
MPELDSFLIDDLIVQHQRGALCEAPAKRQPRPSLIPTVRRFVAACAARWTSAVLIGVSMVAAVQVRGEASTLDQIVKSFAEYVVGQGSVKAVRVSTDATVAMRWQAATYKPQNSVSASRELLYAEAALVTSAILMSLPDVRRIAFTMVRGEQVLAMGEVSRSGSLALRFTPHLGGGIYTQPESRPKLYLPGGHGADL